MRVLLGLLLLLTATASAQTAFPLAPGDTWTYGRVTRSAEGPPEISGRGSVAVRDTVTIQDTTYALVAVPSLFTDTLRTDAEGRVWGRFGGRETLVLDPTVPSGGTYVVTDPRRPDPPFDTYTVTVTHGLAASTVAGDFEDVTGFLFDVPEVADEEIWLAVAPGVGVVQASLGWNAVELIEATVGGTVITSGEGGPEETGTLRVFPTPFAGALTVGLPPGGWRHVEVVDALGRRVAILLDGPRPGGGLLRWDAAGVAPGLYLVRAAGDAGSVTRPVVRSR